MQQLDSLEPLHTRLGLISLACLHQQPRFRSRALFLLRVRNRSAHRSSKHCASPISWSHCTHRFWIGSGVPDSSERGRCSFWLVTVGQVLWRWSDSTQTVAWHFISHDAAAASDNNAKPLLRRSFIADFDAFRTNCVDRVSASCFLLSTGTPLKTLYLPIF